jgi:hypothetical protein
MMLPFRRRDAAALLFAQTPAGNAPDSFPSHPPELAREMVRVAHFDAKRVKELLRVRPVLANAAVDWGFGDWEDALGAASHVGNREIATMLLAEGARPSVFSAAMLGQLEVVRAFIKSQPGIQRTPGPHGISLLAHARDKAMIEYLGSLGDAGSTKAPPLTVDRIAALSGTYVYGARSDQRIEISAKNGELMFTRSGTPGRALIPLDNGSFHPAGAPQVRIEIANGVLTVLDGGFVLKATAAR